MFLCAFTAAAVLAGRSVTPDRAEQGIGPLIAGRVLVVHDRKVEALPGDWIAAVKIAAAKQRGSIRLRIGETEREIVKPVEPVKITQTQPPRDALRVGLQCAGGLRDRRAIEPVRPFTVLKQLQWGVGGVVDVPQAFLGRIGGRAACFLQERVILKETSILAVLKLFEQRREQRETMFPARLVSVSCLAFQNVDPRRLAKQYPAKARILDRGTRRENTVQLSGLFPAAGQRQFDRRALPYTFGAANHLLPECGLPGIPEAVKREAAQKLLAECNRGVAFLPSAVRDQAQDLLRFTAHVKCMVCLKQRPKFRIIGKCLRRPGQFRLSQWLVAFTVSFAAHPHQQLRCKKQRIAGGIPSFPHEIFVIDLCNERTGFGVARLHRFQLPGVEFFQGRIIALQPQRFTDETRRR